MTDNGRYHDSPHESEDWPMPTPTPLPPSGLERKLTWAIVIVGLALLAACICQYLQSKGIIP